MKATHLVSFAEVLRLYAARTPSGTAARTTVKDWLTRRRLRALGGNPQARRVWQRGDVIAALDTDYPALPQFLTVGDALRMAGRGKEARS